MKSKSLLVTIILILALLSLATPAAAGQEPVGDRLYLLDGGPGKFPAGSPFHITHGWLVIGTPEPGTNSGYWGLVGYELEVDGVLREEDFVQSNALEGTRLSRMWVFNFPDGMTGTHTFTYRYLMPCQGAVNAGLYPGPCPTPTTMVQTSGDTVVVKFGK